MQTRIHDTNTFKERIISHPTIQHYLETSVGNKNKQGNKSKHKVAISMIEIAAYSLNEITLLVFLTVLDNESVKSLLFTGKCWPSITADIAASITELGPHKTIEIIETMLDEEVKKFIDENNDETDDTWKIDFMQVKTWGVEETKKIARLLSDPAAAILNQEQSEISDVHSFQQLKNFIDALSSHADVKKFSELGWLEQFDLRCESDNLEIFLKFLRKNEKKLHYLVENNLLKNKDIHLFIRDVPKKHRLELVSRHPIKTIAGFTRETWYLLHTSDAETLEKLTVEFGEVNEKALDFIFRHGIKEKKEANYLLLKKDDFFSTYTSLKKDPYWQAWIIAASFLSIRRAIERNPTLIPPIISAIRNASFEGIKKIKIANDLSKLFLFSQNTSQEIQNAIDNWIVTTLHRARYLYPEFRIVKWLISDSRIRYMLEQGLIKFSEMATLSKNWDADTVIKHWLHKTLMDIKMELSNPKWKHHGFLGIAKPNGIKRLTNLFTALPDYFTPKVNELLLEVIDILEEIKKERKDKKRHPATQTFYDDTYKTLMKWHPDLILTQKPITCDEMEIRKMARLFGQVNRQRDRFFTPHDIQETPITMLPNELLTEIILSQHGTVNKKEAMKILEDHFSKPRVGT